MFTTSSDPKAVVVTVAEAASRVDRKPATLRKWLQRGKLTGHGHDDMGNALVQLSEVEQLTWINASNLVGIPFEPTPGGNGDDLVTAAQAAEYVCVPPSTVRTWITRGFKDQNGNLVRLSAAGLDGRGRKLYRWLDVAKAEAAVRRRAGRDRGYPRCAACHQIVLECAC